MHVLDLRDAALLTGRYKNVTDQPVTWCSGIVGADSNGQLIFCMRWYAIQCSIWYAYEVRSCESCRLGSYNNS